MLIYQTILIKMIESCKKSKLILFNLTNMATENKIKKKIKLQKKLMGFKLIL